MKAFHLVASQKVSLPDVPTPVFNCEVTFVSQLSGNTITKCFDLFPLYGLMRFLGGWELTTCTKILFFKMYAWAQGIRFKNKKKHFSAQQKKKKKKWILKREVQPYTQAHNLTESLYSWHCSTMAKYQHLTLAMSSTFIITTEDFKICFSSRQTRVWTTEYPNNKRKCTLLQVPHLWKSLCNNEDTYPWPSVWTLKEAITSWLENR